MDQQTKEFIDNEINNNEVFKTLPPLIKGYLRLGVHVGEGAVIDKQFNTIDVFLYFSFP